MHEMYPNPDEIAVTASTGMAAQNIDGVTLHRWAGIGSGAEYSYISRVEGNPMAANRWKAVKVLIVDEGACLFYPASFPSNLSQFRC